MIWYRSRSMFDCICSLGTKFPCGITSLSDFQIILSILFRPWVQIIASIFTYLSMIIAQFTSCPFQFGGPVRPGVLSGYESMIRSLNHTVWWLFKRSFLYTVVIQFDIMPLPISTSNIPLLIYRITIVFWRLISSKIFLKWFWSIYETYKFWRFIRKLFLNLVTKSFQN